MSPSSIKQKGNSWCLFFPLGTSHLNFKHLDSHYNIDNTANRKCELVWLVQSANVMLLAIILYSCDCSCILSAYIVSEMKNRDALRITRGYKEAYARPFVGPLVHCPRFFHILILTDCQQLKYISFRSRVSMNVCVASVKKAQVLLLYILAYTEHFGNFTVCHTNMLIYWCHSMYSSFLFYTFIYKGSSLLVGSHSTLRPFSPGFPGNLVRVEEKSKSCEGKASFSLSPPSFPPLSRSLLSVSVVCVYKSLSRHAVTSLWALHCIALGRRKGWRQGGGYNQWRFLLGISFDLPSLCASVTSPAHFPLFSQCVVHSPPVLPVHPLIKRVRSAWTVAASMQNGLWQFLSHQHHRRGWVFQESLCTSVCVCDTGWACVCVRWARGLEGFERKSCHCICSDGRRCLECQWSVSGLPLRLKECVCVFVWGRGCVCVCPWWSLEAMGGRSITKDLPRLRHLGLKNAPLWCRSRLLTP